MPLRIKTVWKSTSWKLLPWSLSWSACHGHWGLTQARASAVTAVGLRCESQRGRKLIPPSPGNPADPLERKTQKVPACRISQAPSGPARVTRSGSAVCTAHRVRGGDRGGQFPLSLAASLCYMGPWRVLKGCDLEPCHGPRPRATDLSCLSNTSLEAGLDSV